MIRDMNDDESNLQATHAESPYVWESSDMVRTSHQ